LSDGIFYLSEKLVVKSDLLGLMCLGTASTFDMSINNNGHEKGKLKLTKRQITSGILGHLSNFNYHLQIITFGRSSKILPYNKTYTITCTIMKTSIKLSVLIFSLLSVISLNIKAQDINNPVTPKTTSLGSGIRLSAGVESGIPLGKLNNNYNLNFGGSLQADFPVIDRQLYVTLNTGFNNIYADDITNAPDIQLIPVKVGLKYFPVKNFYIQGEAGASFIANKTDLGATKSAAFVYAPQVGVLFNVGRKNYIDAGVRFESNSKFYTNGSTSNFIGLRVAYAFNL